MEQKRYFIATFGCQMNVNDSEKIAGLLRAEGYAPATDPESADFVFINTCAVRDKAERKLYHTLDRIGRLKRDRPSLMVGVGGCVAQLRGIGILKRAPFVDVLVGTHTFPRLPELLRQADSGDRPCADLNRTADAFAVPHALIAHSNPVRAYVTVTEGCNQVCSFCVVPRSRGPEVNRADGDIIEEARSLAARGFPEVMLLGQTVNAYRYGTVDFAGLLERIDVVPGLRRLRFATSHPNFVSDRLARCLRDLRTACPYIHLPVQSGSDRVLASMRRGHTRTEYLERLALLREFVPGIAISSDIIVGYPGESESDFEATLDLIERAGFDGLFVFHYSPRPGTTAFGLPNDIPLVEKKRRLQEVNSRQQRAQSRRNADRVGHSEEVLVEAFDAAGRAVGRTPQFRIVHVDGTLQIGELVLVEITASGPNALIGRAMSTNGSLTVSSSVPIF